MAAMELNSRSLAQRSQFVFKLHELLENPLDPNSLRWTDDIVFEISCSDEKAINALSPNWDFNSLGSFIRQLSYYGFKRLSDRRRSGQVKQNREEFIIFSHPSGHFKRGDTSKLDEIGRKARSRVSKTVTSQNAVNNNNNNNNHNNNNNNSNNNSNNNNNNNNNNHNNNANRFNQGSPRGKESSYDTPDDTDDSRNYKPGDPRRKAGHDDYTHYPTDSRRGSYGGRDLYHGGGEGSSRAQPRRKFEHSMNERGSSGSNRGGHDGSGVVGGGGGNNGGGGGRSNQGSHRGNPVPYVVSPTTSPQPRSRLLPPLSEPYSNEQRSRPSSSASSYSSTESRSLGPRLPPLNHMHGHMPTRSANSWIPPPIKSGIRGNLTVPDQSSPPSHFNRQQQQQQQQQQINRGRMPVSSERESAPLHTLPSSLPIIHSPTSGGAVLAPIPQVSVNSSLYRLLSHSPPRINPNNPSHSTPGSANSVTSITDGPAPVESKKSLHQSNSAHSHQPRIVKAPVLTGWAKPFPPANPSHSTSTASSTFITSTSPGSRTRTLMEEEGLGSELGRRRSLSVKKEA